MLAKPRVESEEWESGRVGEWEGGRVGGWVSAECRWNHGITESRSPTSLFPDWRVPAVPE